MAGVARKVVQCDKDGNEIRVFISAKEASESFGSRWSTNIHKAIKYGSLAFGYRWKYLGGNLEDIPIGTPGKARKVVAVSVITKDSITYPSISEASRQLGIGITSIESSLQTGSKAKGYRFHYEDVGTMPISRKRISTAVVAIDENDEIALEFPSAKEAAIALGITSGAIYWCLNRKRPDSKCKGYRWRYKEG